MRDQCIRIMERKIGRTKHDVQAGFEENATPMIRLQDHLNGADQYTRINCPPTLGV